MRRRLFTRALARFASTALGKHLSFDLWMRAGRHPVRVPVVMGIGARNVEPSEPWMIPALDRLCSHKSGAVIDVGVNLGQTLIAYLSTGHSARYIGFEPNPHCVHYARQVAECNEAKQVTIVPYGLADHYGTMTLFANGVVDSAASLVPGFRDPAEYTCASVVAIAPGDALVESLGVDDISVVKIDVEGAELDVLRGLRGTIQRTRPFILCEVLPIYDDECANGSRRRARTDDLLALLHGWDYVIYRQLHDGSLVRCDGIRTHGDLALSDYLFSPRERAAWLFSGTPLEREEDLPRWVQSWNVTAGRPG